jgi:Tfp pilus assembly protein PilF
MAKSGKASPKNTPAAAPRSSVKAVLPAKDWLSRPPLDELSASDKTRFWAIALLGLCAMIFLAFGSGINADDKFQVDYSQKLVSYYSTFGKDTSALNIPDGNMHLYGGFFETVTGFASKAFGLQPTDIGYHHVRHVGSAIMGWLAILCAALLAQLIAGRGAGYITLFLLFVSPRFVGDSLMNPKDIPFAAGYIMALYNLAAVYNRMPNPGRWNLAGLALGLGIALGTRAGGLLSFGMLGMFAGLHFLLKNGGFRAFSDLPLLKKYAMVTLGTAAAGYVFALLFWPYALQAPLSNPFVALSKFADLEVKIRVLFEGVNQMSDKTPWYYPVKWIAYTVPVAVLLGFVGSVLLLVRSFRRYNPLWVSMAFFAAVFPVFYVIYKNSVIHDGWRHLTFAYPPMVVCASLCWKQFGTLSFWPKKYAPYIVGLALCLTSYSGYSFIIDNPKFPYLYFNELAGGIKGAYGKFETDYWGVSTRQGIEWLEERGILKPDMPETVVIATNMFYSVKQLTAKYGDKVKVKYLKWEKRCDDAWDYALYPTRFIDGVTLQKGLWPPDNAVHIVEAKGVPILAVLKDTERNCALGMAAFKLGDWNTAIQRLEVEVAKVPDNDLAWVNLAQAYLNNGQLEDAKRAAEKTLDISPDDSQANNLIGLYWLNKNDIAKAKAQFEVSIKKEASNPGAWYYLALIARSQGDNQTALSNLMKAIQISPNFKAAYELSAQIYESMGDTGNAQRFRAATGL